MFTPKDKHLHTNLANAAFFWGIDANSRRSVVGKADQVLPKGAACCVRLYRACLGMALIFVAIFTNTWPICVIESNLCNCFAASHLDTYILKWPALWGRYLICVGSLVSKGCGSLSWKSTQSLSDYEKNVWWLFSSRGSFPQNRFPQWWFTPSQKVLYFSWG